LLLRDIANKTKRRDGDHNESLFVSLKQAFEQYRWKEQKNYNIGVIATGFQKRTEQLRLSL
jgi:hypothetical protein